METREEEFKKKIYMYLLDTVNQCIEDCNVLINELDEKPIYKLKHVPPKITQAHIHLKIEQNKICLKQKKILTKRVKKNRGSRNASVDSPVFYHPAAIVDPFDISNSPKLPHYDMATDRSDSRSGSPSASSNFKKSRNGGRRTKKGTKRTQKYKKPNKY